MQIIDFSGIVEAAWQAYDVSREISSITDISARVSTNHVYKIAFRDKTFVIAKLSYFGQYEHFLEDHTIINVLANNLPAPFERFLARSLIKGNELFTYRHRAYDVDVWVVFYNPVRIDRRLPRRLDEAQIEQLGEQFARLHLACAQLANTLPPSSKTLRIDLEHLLGILDTPTGRFEHRMYEEEIRSHCDRFFEACATLGESRFLKIPVFVDWNIGNFSVTRSGRFYSRWDYDWFRMSTRIMDFYFISRIVSDIGDRTVFTYNIGPLMEERFLRFLRAYHSVYPLSEREVHFMREAYRFFILNYVIKDGRYFFHEVYATKLLREAYELCLPSVDRDFDAGPILRALGL
ncbi:MAG: hypothetical protein OHK0039_29990 [Bacteroidia bacterium]